MLDYDEHDRGDQQFAPHVRRTLAQSRLARGGTRTSRFTDRAAAACRSVVRSSHRAPARDGQPTRCGSRPEIEGPGRGSRPTRGQARRRARRTQSKARTPADPRSDPRGRLTARSGSTLSTDHEIADGATRALDDEFHVAEESRGQLVAPSVRSASVAVVPVVTELVRAAGWCLESAGVTLPLGDQSGEGRAGRDGSRRATARPKTVDLEPLTRFDAREVLAAPSRACRRGSCVTP